MQTILDRLCKPDAIFVDVGGHIGSVIAGAARNSRPAHIISIEAIPEKAAAPRKRFPKAQIIEAAVGDHESEVDFTVDLARPGFSSLNPDVALATSSFKTIRVKLQLWMRSSPPKESI